MGQRVVVCAKNAGKALLGIIGTLERAGHTVIVSDLQTCKEWETETDIAVYYQEPPFNLKDVLAGLKVLGGLFRFVFYVGAQLPPVTSAPIIAQIPLANGQTPAKVCLAVSRIIAQKRAEEKYAHMRQRRVVPSPVGA